MTLVYIRSILLASATCRLSCLIVITWLFCTYAKLRTNYYCCENLLNVYNLLRDPFLMPVERNETNTAR